MNCKETLSDSYLFHLHRETEAFLSQLNPADCFDIDDEIGQVGQGIRNPIRLHLYLSGTQENILQQFDQDQR